MKARRSCGVKSVKAIRPKVARKVCKVGGKVSFRVVAHMTGACTRRFTVRAHTVSEAYDAAEVNANALSRHLFRRMARQVYILVARKDRNG